MKITIVVLIIATALALNACEEVIRLDLESTEPRTVVEAVVDAGAGTCSVQMSKTADYYSVNAIEKIPGASIFLTTSAGLTYQLFDSGNGSYFAGGIPLQYSDTATISITTKDNITYTAAAITPLRVTMDSLEVMIGSRPSFGNGEVDYDLFAIWKDSASVKNFYRLRITVNDTLQANRISLANDRIQDGKVFRQPIFGGDFLKGDTVKIELLSVDEEYYNYFRQIARGGGPGGGAATPYNPKGNFNNNVLGYFGIIFRSEKQVILR